MKIYEGLDLETDEQVVLKCCGFDEMITNEITILKVLK